MTTQTNPMDVAQDVNGNTQEAVRRKLLPKLLRGFGATTLIAAVSIFLLQGWENGNDVQRYLLLLVHTAGLAILGFVSGRWIGETKGARLLVALALASIPANFAILGGFVYSQWALDGISVVYPGFASWHAQDPATALLTLGVALAVLLPVIWLGFMVLARRSAARFTLLYLFTNLALLIPLRGAELIGWLTLALSALVLLHITRARQGNTSLKTPEGVVARALQFLPLGLLLARSLWLYAADTFLFTVLSLVIFLLLRNMALQFEPAQRKREFLEYLSLIPAATSAYGVTFLVANAFIGEPSLYLLVFTFTLATLVMEISLRAGDGGATFRRIAALVLTGGMFANLLLFGGVAMAALCLMLGLLVMVYGYMVEQRVVFTLGAITLLAGLVYQVHYAIKVFDLGSWSSLAALGVSAILIGSAIERHGPRIKAKLLDWNGRFRSWQY